jgi:hypothetical protein
MRWVSVEHTLSPSNSDDPIPPTFDPSFDAWAITISASPSSLPLRLLTEHAHSDLDQVRI